MWKHPWRISRITDARRKKKKKRTSNRKSRKYDLLVSGAFAKNDLTQAAL